ncbi:MAG: molybdopterin-dependent oxidoreductase [Desulfarculus sp.]|nr:molybdopterin-dependent oxidoreductase [Desulfarculus sp.]
MNWDRRAFVKFAVGAVVGLHASPLVPKLMDDSAIWTQNWNWVPNPEDGALAFANTVNPATGTGVKVRVIAGRLKGERLIRVEGNPEHPTSKGGVVPADASALQNLYYDDFRVKTPLILDQRTGMHVEASWEQALDLVAGKLAELHKAGQAHTVAALGTEAKTLDGELLSRFMAAYGSPNTSFNVSASDTLAMAGWAMTGEENLGFDLLGANYVISFGTPLLEGFGSPVAVRKAFAAWRKDFKRTGTLVQVEPRASVTASQADQWLAVKPGTEAAVALGLCQVLIQEGLYDRSIAGAALGFEDGDKGLGFKTLLAKNYSPGQVAQISGVPVETLITVAKAFAKEPKAVAVCGPGNGGEPGRLLDFMAVLALNALKGNLGKPGGLVARQPLGLKPLGEAVAYRGDKPRLDGLGTAKRPLGAADHLSLAKGALAGAPYKVNLALVAGGNPAFCAPQAGVVRDFLKSVPFVVAITPYLDESSSQAQVVLPCGTFLESWGDSLTPYGAAQAEYGLHRPLIKAYEKVKSQGDVILALAAKLGGAVAQALPHATAEAALKARTAGLGELAKLAKKSYVVQEKPVYGNLGFKTPSGKLEFFSMNLHNLAVKLSGEGGMAKVLKAMGVSAEGPAALMPHYEPPAALAKAGHGRLVLAAVASLRTPKGDQPITPYMLKVLDGDTLANKDQMVVEMNPQTAHDLHLYEGDLVKVTSTAGSTEARVHMFAGAAPGMVFMPVGLGHYASQNAYTYRRGGNYNQVAEATADPLSGLPTWGLTPVAVSKA